MTYEEFVVTYEDTVGLMLKHAHVFDNPYIPILADLVDEYPEFEKRYDGEN